MARSYDDAVKKTQTFTSDGGGGDTTETTKYYYNQARMSEYIDLAESNEDLEFTHNSVGTT